MDQPKPGVNSTPLNSDEKKIVRFISMMLKEEFCGVNTGSQGVRKSQCVYQLPLNAAKKFWETAQKIKKSFDFRLFF